MYFPRIVSTIESAHVPDLDGYTAAVRSAVCAQCEDQDDQHNCWKRNRLECALDRYMPLIVEIVEHRSAHVVS
jgi:hypothetical protein